MTEQVYGAGQRYSNGQDGDKKYSVHSPPLASSKDHDGKGSLGTAQGVTNLRVKTSADSDAPRCFQLIQMARDRFGVVAVCTQRLYLDAYTNPYLLHSWE